jgi:hypothetical protein
MVGFFYFIVPLGWDVACLLSTPCSGACPRHVAWHILIRRSLIGGPALRSSANIVSISVFPHLSLVPVISLCRQNLVDDSFPQNTNHFLFSFSMHCNAWSSIPAHTNDGCHEADAEHESTLLHLAWWTIVTGMRVDALLWRG